MKRIGLTMRIVQADGYDEPRNALACDWHAFLAPFATAMQWLPIPNLGESAPRFAEQWELDGIVLTGGEDLGVAPERDRTEFALLSHCIDRRLPVLGVCRGLQVMQSHFGGLLTRCAPERHVATTHTVHATGELRPFGDRGGTFRVNSYHRLGIANGAEAEGFRVGATDDDGHVECMAHETHPLFGIMWHPERPSPDDDLNTRIFAATFGLGAP